MFNWPIKTFGFIGIYFSTQNISKTSGESLSQLIAAIWFNITTSHANKESHSLLVRAIYLIDILDHAHLFKYFSEFDYCEFNGKTVHKKGDRPRDTDH